MVGIYYMYDSFLNAKFFFCTVILLFEFLMLFLKEEKKHVKIYIKYNHVEQIYKDFRN